ncbi:Carbon-nitrogen hydrolase family protein [Roseomonas mucosa]|uniref:Carbon-nitrogen hydrolase family protein n=1 Tax=Roseomonas mucosa TaxID=207340 RepID=A0A4Y1N032_9PROT|nr:MULTISPECIES: carbon-nitrogen hydrolase family protein [Roseomonas]ATR20031.1 carbon-nitrogen hydrolase [Roseomonas sp. FDAARGOS_362]AWV23527.1 Carbon-nitrogen hydrolase family protein [Roseomonas mucosa]MDT8277087.1 carbon-nitrogen hydrolase family protein [Roseomonas mucosa]MDT8353196.1 carbon-nitrogen hydrolase family protein [Roseomonas mucosa]USQ71922.1 carbon-nitrogen hydrolase family protein [Roseomonas mucosa]
MTPPAPLRLALLQYPVERPRDVAAFAAKLDTWLARIAGQADLAVLPEYAAVELGAALSGNAWAGSTGDGLAVDEAGELRAMTDAAPAILAAMQEAARRAGLWLLPGTLPMRGPDGLVRNRAPLIDPEGRLAFQDKRFMTRFEAERWIVSPGAAPQVFDTPWGRIGISICYDVEFPAHVRAQVEAGAWLVLAPSCTDTMHGFNRVRFSAAARALESQCYVAVTPTVGLAPWSAALDVNRGFAAVFGPVDRGFPEDGVLARGALDEPGWVLATLDPARIEAVRADGGVRNHHDWPAAPFPIPLPGRFA